MMAFRAGRRRLAARSAATAVSRDDNAMAAAGLVYGLLTTLVWFLQVELRVATPWPVAAMTGLFTVHLLLIRRTLNDPVVMFVAVMFMYSFLPAIADLSAPGSTLGFDLADAYDLFNVGQIATMLGVTVSCGLLRRQHVPHLTPDDSLACLLGGVFAGLLGIALISAAISVRGFVLGGAVSYAESFAQQVEAGNGFYMLCVPLSLASIGLILASRHPGTVYALPIPVLCAVLIAVGIGQRKYFIQPLLFIFAFYWTSRRVLHVLGVIAATVLGFLVFCYLGFLRINALSIDAVLSIGEWRNFFSEIGVYVGSETVYLYATASAAATNFVLPLDHAGDYLFAWVLGIPRFLMTDTIVNMYTPANDRFSFAYNALDATFGLGYGFSFLGEAYLVGGLPVIAIVVILEICLFRFLYLRGGGAMPSGAWGAISLISLYFALWIQRNALGLIVREFFVSVVGVTLIMYYAGKAVSWILIPTLAKVHAENRREQEARALALPHPAAPSHDVSLPGRVERA